MKKHKRQECSLNKYCLTYFTIIVQYNFVTFLTFHEVVFQFEHECHSFQLVFVLKCCIVLFTFKASQYHNILNSAHLPGTCPSLIVPENIPLSFSCLRLVAAIIWNVIALEHYRRLALPQSQPVNLQGI